MSEDRKMLEPLTSVVSVTLRILLGALVAGFLLSLFVEGVHWGRGDLCVTVDWASTSGGDFHPFEPSPGRRSATRPASAPRNRPPGSRCWVCCVPRP